MSESIERYELELRNVPRQRVLEYLEQAGGTLVEALVAQGSGWQARLQALDPVVLGIATIPRDLLILEGRPDALRPVYDHMRRMTMRGGG